MKFILINTLPLVNKKKVLLCCQNMKVFEFLPIRSIFPLLKIDNY